MDDTDFQLGFLEYTRGHKKPGLQYFQSGRDDLLKRATYRVAAPTQIDGTLHNIGSAVCWVCVGEIFLGRALRRLDGAPLRQVKLVSASSFVSTISTTRGKGLAYGSSESVGLHHYRLSASRAVRQLCRSRNCTGHCFTIDQTIRQKRVGVLAARGNIKPCLAIDAMRGNTNLAWQYARNSRPTRTEGRILR